MLKKIKKAKLFLPAVLAFIFILTPLYSAEAFVGKIGQACRVKEDCIDNNAGNYTDWNENEVIYNEGVDCIASRCVVTPEHVAIGTWCDSAVQCEDDTGTLQFTCNKDLNYCVAAVSNVECIDDLARINQDSNIGVAKEDIPLSNRCDTGLVCEKDKGVCVPDYGQGKVPSDKLGDAASDIRDQIRNLINIALGFLGVAGVIVVIYGGAIWMSAAGDDEKVEKAKKTIVSGLIGLVIIGIAWTIVSYVLTVTKQIS